MYDVAAMSLSGQAAIVGVYESPMRKSDGVHPFAVQQQCIKGALEDAGLTIDDVDGLATCAGDFAEGGTAQDITEVAEYLGIVPTYFDSTDVGGSSYVTHAGHAAAAIASGLADVIVVSYAACMRWWPVPGMWDEALFPAGPGQFDVINPGSIPAFYALVAQRHMHEFGTTREQLAEIAVTCRANAANNEHARYRDPLTVQDVLDAPTVASPFGRFDCCVVTDSGGAFVMTNAERAKDCRKPPVWVGGFGEAVATVQMSQMDPLTSSPARFSGPKAFAMAGVKHEDIDVAQLYDAFTITPLLAIEDLGFCDKGDGGPFVEAGGIRPDGSLPINTDGGGLSSNHPGKRGMFVVIEAVRQLRGEGPGVQIEGAKTALCNGNGGFVSASATLILNR